MFRKQKSFFRCLIFLAISLCLISLSGCVVKKIITDPEDKNLRTGAYRKAVIHQYEADQNLTQKHPHAAVLCENATFQELLRIGTIPMIVKTSSSASLRESDTIVIKVRLTYIRETTQTRGKTKTGPAVMTAQVRLIDASTGTTVHDQYISIANQPSVKSTEDPSELGKLIAMHISRIIQNM